MGKKAVTTERALRELRSDEEEFAFFEAIAKLSSKTKPSSISPARQQVIDRLAREEFERRSKRRSADSVWFWSHSYMAKSFRTLFVS